MTRPKVFNLGLEKTGTTALHEALETLGLRSSHDVHFGRRVRLDAEAGHASTLMDDLDALTHFDQLPRVADLLRAWPDALYVVTTRDRDRWVESRLLHCLQVRMRGDFTRHPPIDHHVSTRDLETRWEEHYGEVRRFSDSLFKDRLVWIRCEDPDELKWTRLKGLLFTGEGRYRFPDGGILAHNSLWPVANGGEERARDVYQRFLNRQLRTSDERECRHA